MNLEPNYLEVRTSENFELSLLYQNFVMACVYMLKRNAKLTSVKKVNPKRYLLNVTSLGKLHFIERLLPSLC